MPITRLFENFIDDAAIFPPGLVPLDRAVSNNIKRRRHIVAPLIGPLILPIDRLEEAARYAGSELLKVSVVASDRCIDRLIELCGPSTPLSNIAIVAAEIKRSSESSEGEWRDRLSQLTEQCDDLTVWAELPYEAIRLQLLEWFKAQSINLKFRTGGIRQELFPTPTQLVDVSSLAVESGVRFKLTAGLHRAVCYTDSQTSFRHFGFLNIAAAVVELQEGKGQEAALEALNDKKAERIATTVTRNNEWRNTFISFGTCSVVEPLETLTELSLYRSENIPEA